MVCGKLASRLVIFNLVHEFFLASAVNIENKIRQTHNTDCSIPIYNNASASEILSYLINSCRYKPYEGPAKHSPVVVKARIYIYYLESEPTYNLQFKAQMLLQLKWRDERLAYEAMTSTIKEIHGSHRIIPKIWTPYVYLTNEKNSLILRSSHKDVLVSFLPDGKVLYTTRLKSTIFCWIQLGKFPFDHQQCHLILDSWRYSNKNLVLQWEFNETVNIPEDVRYLTDYKLISMKAHKGFIPTESKTFPPNGFKVYRYSCLTLTFLLARNYQYYVMHYYLPSVLLVIISWVSFWLEPEAMPARVTLGISTMLTFLALSAETGSSLPNVSYIRANDVWFMACTAFIMLSLIEFAFVNSIWRRGLHQVLLKKPTPKYIIKSSISPKRTARRRSLSVPSSPEIRRDSLSTQGTTLNQLTVKSLGDLSFMAPMFELQDLRRTNTEVTEGLAETKNVASDSEITLTPTETSTGTSTSTATMTTQDIALWIDKKSRLIFPIFFCIFNIFYWTLVRY